MGRYQYEHSERSATAHLAALVVEHADTGLVVDIGCGYGNLARPLADAGFDYLGIDTDVVAVAAVREAGFEAHVVDASAGDLSASIVELVGDRRLSAITAIDVIEHLPRPAAFLAGMHALAAERGAVLGVSVPNVTHQDLAVKLVAGRWDVTDTGLLDETHLQLFDERRLDALMSASGFAEVGRRDFELLRTEQGVLHAHPVVYAHTSVGHWLRELRSRAGGAAETYQFVRVYRPVEPGEAVDLSPPESQLPAPSFTVLVRGGATPDLTAQVRGPEVVRPLSPDEHLPAALAGVTTSHFCVVDASDRLPADWLAALDRALRDHPAAVGRYPVATRSGRFAGAGLVRTAAEGDEPLAAFAVPVAPSRQMRMPSADDQQVALWALLVATWTLTGIVDAAADGSLPAVSPPADRGAVLAVLAAEQLLLPLGWTHEFATLAARLRTAESALSSPEHRVAARVGAWGRAAVRLVRRR